MTIHWDASMASGLASIDEQHRKLIGYLNDLQDAMALGGGRAEVARILQATRHYAALHFGHEEACMRRYQCPVAAANERAHASFVATFDRLQSDFDRTGPSVDLVLRVQRELCSWIQRHIKGTDAALRPCVLAAPAGWRAAG